jgi:hypothetical protein
MLQIEILEKQLHVEEPEAAESQDVELIDNEDEKKN